MELWLTVFNLIPKCVSVELDRHELGATLLKNGLEPIMYDYDPAVLAVILTAHAPRYSILAAQLSFLEYAINFYRRRVGPLPMRKWAVHNEEPSSPPKIVRTSVPEELFSPADANSNWANLLTAVEMVKEASDREDL